MDQKHPSPCDKDSNENDSLQNSPNFISDAEDDSLEDIPEHVRNTTEIEDLVHDLLEFGRDYDDVSLCDYIMSEHGIMVFKRYFPDKITLLHIVAQYSDPKVAERLLKFGAKVNIRDAEGRTPLYEALQYGATKEICDVFLKYGADIYIRCKKNISPLLQALFSRCLEIIETFLKLPEPQEHEAITEVLRCKRILKTVFAQKIDFKLCITDFPVLFFFAASHCNDEVFNIVVEEYKQFIESNSGDGEMKDAEKEIISHVNGVNVRGHYGRTALHYAVKEELSDVVRYLIKQGADVNAKTEKNYTPLHYAAALENKEIIEILLEAGADVNVRSTDDCSDDTMVTALNLVCGDLPLRDLIQPGHGINYNEYIASSNLTEDTSFFNIELIKLLLKNGADIESLKQNATTFFFQACEAGDLDLVKLFFTCGADVHKLKYNTTALDFAAYGENTAVVDFILRHSNFDINTTNESGDSILHISVKFLSTNMIEFVADKGANINALNNNHDTPLHFAACVENLASLWELKPDIQARNKQNYTPLFQQLVTMIREQHKPPTEVYLIPFMALKENDISAYIENFKTSDEWQGVFSFFEECKREIDQMKKRRIVSNIRFSFYEFLTLDIYSVIAISKNEEVMKVLEAYEYREEFPIYKPILERRILTVKSLEVSVENILEFLKEYGEFKLPTFLTETILSYLVTRDLRNFGRALSVWKD